MPSRREMRSEETKAAILAAARKLFAEQGYDAVTMREIAKAADCSHTTIYIYFKDKEALLHQLSQGPLEELRAQMAAALAAPGQTPEQRLAAAGRVFIRFCLTNRNMYTIFFMARATRVDEESPVLDVNRLRNDLFGMLRQGVAACLPAGTGSDQVLACARVFFFMMHGIIGTYIASEEPLEALFERLAPTFDLAISALIAGLMQEARGV